MTIAHSSVLAVSVPFMARWAVFFDALGVKYEYEPEGFQRNGVYYLPDFLIYDVEGEHAFGWRQNIYVEVKGVPDEDSAKKPSDNKKAPKDPNVGADGSEQLTLV